MDEYDTSIDEMIAQMHSSEYQNPDKFVDKNVCVVGAGNSAAQILAEVADVARSTHWVTPDDTPPEFYPPVVDGSVLFERAVQVYEARQRGRSLPVFRFPNIIQVEPVRAALLRGVYDPPHSTPPAHIMAEPG